MIQLVKKDLFLFALFSVPLQLMLSLAWLLTFNDLNLLVVLVQVLYVFFTIIVLTSHSEQVEEANHGYEFLQNLPVSTLEIVAAKFFLILATAVFLALSNILLFYLLGANTGGLKLPVTFLIMTCCAALVLSALVHLVISALGGNIFFVVTSVLVSVSAVSFALLMGKKKMGIIDSALKRAVHFLQHGNIPLYILISLVVFLLLMFIAVWVKKTGRIRTIKRFFS